MPMSKRSFGQTGGFLTFPAVLLSILLAGCETSGSANIQGIGKGEACINDSKDCIAQRSAALNALLVDKKNHWISQPPSSHSYASGVRLFAYKSRKKSLSCNELAKGSKEADAAPSVLRGPGGKSFTPAQVSRGLMFATEVSRELKRESRQRCGGA